MRPDRQGNRFKLGRRKNRRIARNKVRNFRKMDEKPLELRKNELTKDIQKEPPDGFSIPFILNCPIIVRYLHSRSKHLCSSLVLPQTVSFVVKYHTDNRPPHALFGAKQPQNLNISSNVGTLRKNAESIFFTGCQVTWQAIKIHWLHQEVVIIDFYHVDTRDIGTQTTSDISQNNNHERLQKSVLIETFSAGDV